MGKIQVEESGSTSIFKPDVKNWNIKRTIIHLLSIPTLRKGSSIKSKSRCFNGTICYQWSIFDTIQANVTFSSKLNFSSSKVKNQYAVKFGQKKIKKKKIEASPNHNMLTKFNLRNDNVLKMIKATEWGTSTK